MRHEEFKFNCSGNFSVDLEYVVERYPPFKQYVLEYGDELGRQICLTEFSFQTKLELFYDVQLGLGEFCCFV